MIHEASEPGHTNLHETIRSCGFQKPVRVFSWIGTTRWSGRFLIGSALG